MKKKIIIFTFILITLFIIFNYKVFLWNYYFSQANNNYIASNFSWALDWYNNSLNYLSWSNLNYNKWNTYYRIWEKEKNLDEKINDYTKSLNLYKNILEEDKKSNKKEDQDTRFNYEFVKKKLEELQEQKHEEQEQQEEEQQEQEQQEEQNWDEENSEGEQQDANTWEDNSGQNWSEESIEESENATKQFLQTELSPEELKQVEDYIENLNQEEKYNREYFNNVQPLQIDPFFDDLFDRWWEKDW